MTGSHEVEGSIPFSSTNKINGLRVMPGPLFLSVSALCQHQESVFAEIFLYPNPVTISSNAASKLASSCGLLSTCLFMFVST